jgi:hypothetical protein
MILLVLSTCEKRCRRLFVSGMIGDPRVPYCLAEGTLTAVPGREEERSTSESLG